jgi:hypothetical protein
VETKGAFGVYAIRKNCVALTAISRIRRAGQLISHGIGCLKEEVGRHWSYGHDAAVGDGRPSIEDRRKRSGNISADLHGTA